MDITGCWILPWLYNYAFPVVTMKEQNGLGYISPMVSFETNPYPHNAIKTICREKKKRWVLCVSHQLQSVILVSFFPFAWKGTIEKRERLAWCIVLHLEGSSFLRWTIRSPFKSTVHFYRECERVVICDWNREMLYYCISYLFPKCSHGSMVLLIFYSWRVMHYMFMMYIGVVLTKW